MHAFRSSIIRRTAAQTVLGLLILVPLLRPAFIAGHAEATSAEQLVTMRGLGLLGLRDSKGLVFAPSRDRTNASAGAVSLYLADSGLHGETRARAAQADGREASLGSAEQSSGRIPELALAEPASAAPGVSTEPASLVRTIQTSRWSPPSPDPSGITYLPATNRLLISDGEVEEMNIYQGANLFEATLAGSLERTANTLAFSDEPVGVGVHPGNGRIFIADDNQRRVFEVDPGPDGRIGSTDDNRTSFDTGAFNSTDPEGVAYGQGQLYIADGLDAEVYVVNPGANGRFDGVAPAGDDRVTHWDTAGLGLRDPEGIDFNPDRGTLFLVANSGDADVVETTTTGSLVRVIETSFLEGKALAGVAYAPSSVQPGEKSLYITDRGIDNDADPRENDGKVYEIALGSVAPPPATPTATPIPTAAPVLTQRGYMPLVWR